MSDQEIQANNYYRELLNSLEAVSLDLGSLQYGYLLPQEKESLKLLPFFPKVTADYISRAQAINLLGRFRVGITLEVRVYELSIDNNEESDKVTTQ